MSFTSIITNSRPIPHHGYTISSVSRKRFCENTTAVALTLGIVCPTLNSVNQKLDDQIKSGVDISVEEYVDLFAEKGKSACLVYLDRMARVACQTGLACVLIATDKEYPNSFVYLWDLYPRLHRRYVGQLLGALYIPRFVSTLLGPAPNEVDIAFLTTSTSALGSFEDSLKRSSIPFCADVIVDVVRTLLDKNVKDKKGAVKAPIVNRAIGVVASAVGAGLGRCTLGERGEYWGELVGFYSGFSVYNFIRVYIASKKKSSRRSSTSATGKQAEHRQ